MYFPRARLAVFIHGCFWHRCPTCDLQLPKANGEFWANKFRENERRDHDAELALVGLGITPLVIWEHDTTPEPANALAKLREAISRARSVAG
jgi:DNA mismatch endonuclease (patch repair protein)